SGDTMARVSRVGSASVSVSPARNCWNTHDKPTPPDDAAPTRRVRCASWFDVVLNVDEDRTLPRADGAAPRPRAVAPLGAHSARPAVPGARAVGRHPPFD